MIAAIALLVAAVIVFGYWTPQGQSGQKRLYPPMAHRIESLLYLKTFEV
jgi:hypothetical protein